MWNEPADANIKLQQQKLWAYVQSFAICKVQAQLDLDHGSRWQAGDTTWQSMGRTKPWMRHHQEARGQISSAHHLIPSSGLTAPPYTLHETHDGRNCRPRMTVRPHHSMRHEVPRDDSELRPEGYLEGGGEGPVPLLPRAWWGWGYSGTSNSPGSRIASYCKSAPKSKHLLQSCVLGTSLASPQSITCEQECDDLTGYSSSVQPQEILQLSSVQSIPVLPCSICLTLSTRLFSLLNLTEVGSAVLWGSRRRLGMICGQRETSFN